MERFSRQEINLLLPDEVEKSNEMIKLKMSMDLA